MIYGAEVPPEQVSAEEWQQVMAEHGAFIAEITKRGAYKGGEALHETSKATTVRIRNGKPIITDGPFAETKEQLGGYYLLDCKNLDEAIEIAKLCPGNTYGSIELRPLIEFDGGLFKGINVVSIVVPDLAKARAFYGNVLGLGEPVLDMGEMGWLEYSVGAVEGHISITTAEGAFVPSHHTTVVLNTADCHKTAAELRQRGVKCDDPVGIPGVVTYCSFYDPFGNRLQMCSPPPAA
jgi:predicted enzyme related to lactoylglutathione lyase